MRLKKCLNFFILLSFLSNCASPLVDTSKCQKFKKTSKEYVACMNKIISSTNTAKNMKEFKKHKSLKSFFKQVEVIQSD
tara:strand:- start:154 stop:390 length:237 start_codon:yes stop_codon:yes gene_type:complete